MTAHPNLRATVGVLALGALACATPAANAPLPEAGASCEGTWSHGTDGVAVVPFAGTVYGRSADGTRHPVEGARFVVVEGAQYGSLPIRTDAGGRFQGKVLLPTHGTKECRDGLVKAGYVMGSATISVQAKHCEDAEVTVDARWEPQSIDLRCEP